jgi:Sec-independent protein translocase protein TatA
MKKIALLLVVFATAISTGAFAQREHPAYLHALSDLRAARWMLDHAPGGWKKTEDEQAAVRKIDDAIGEIKKAAIDDHKDLNDHPKDEINEHEGRLTKALEYEKRARADLDKEEDNDSTHGLRKRAWEHIDEAIRLTERARKH